MLDKLAVFQTVGKAYRFLFSEIGTIVRLGWLPILILTMVDYLNNFALSEGTAVSAVSGGEWAVSLLGYLVQAGAWSMVAVAIHRLILFQDRRPGTYALFSLGRVESYFVLT